MIRNNVHKYSVSAMCDVLEILRSTYYYHFKKREDDERQTEEVDLQERIYTIFKQSRRAVLPFYQNKKADNLRLLSQLPALRLAL